MVLGKLTLIVPGLLLACGQVVGPPDGSADSSTQEDVGDAGSVDDFGLWDVTCDGLGTSKGVDSCCNGTYCNGRCTSTGGCYCSTVEVGGCPVSENCCWTGNALGFRCVAPSLCKTCADVGKGPGIETCCSGEYCNGQCDLQGDCVCGGQGCTVGNLCCPLADGGQSCIADASVCP